MSSSRCRLEKARASSAPHQHATHQGTGYTSGYCWCALLAWHFAVHACKLRSDWLLHCVHPELGLNRVRCLGGHFCHRDGYCGCGRGGNAVDCCCSWFHLQHHVVIEDVPKRHAEPVGWRKRSTRCRSVRSAPRCWDCVWVWRGRMRGRFPTRCRNQAARRPPVNRSAVSAEGARAVLLGKFLVFPKGSSIDVELDSVAVDRALPRLKFRALPATAD